jgi:HlyD family secretion protein
LRSSSGEFIRSRGRTAQDPIRFATSTISVAALALSLVLGGCRKDQPDAYGSFEATETVVSAEGSGRLLRLEAREGQTVAAGAVVALVDTTALALRTQELAAQQAASRTRTREAEEQIDVLQAQLATAREEHARTQRLFRAEAATAQQLNVAEGEVRVLQQRIEAARAQTETARQEIGGVEARTAQVREQIRKSQVINPAAGTVLATYAEAGEFVQPGQPLYKVADLRNLTLRAYVSGAQLSAVRIGQRVTVQVDAGPDARQGFAGTVTWISPEAEFTPTPIQTREERTEQVYAVQVRVANPDGMLKIGMPGELVLAPAAQPKRAGR